MKVLEPWPVHTTQTYFHFLSSRSNHVFHLLCSKVEFPLLQNPSPPWRLQLTPADVESLRFHPWIALARGYGDWGRFSTSRCQWSLPRSSRYPDCSQSWHLSFVWKRGWGPSEKVMSHQSNLWTSWVSPQSRRWHPCFVERQRRQSFLCFSASTHLECRLTLRRDGNC